MIDSWSDPCHSFWRVALEKRVLAQDELRRSSNTSSSSNNPYDAEELKKAVLAKMKSVTKAQEEICVALLEDHKYDLKTSIEAFYAS